MKIDLESSQAAVVFSNDGKIQTIIPNGKDDDQIPDSAMMAVCAVTLFVPENKKILDQILESLEKLKSHQNVSP